MRMETTVNLTEASSFQFYLFLPVPPAKRTRSQWFPAEGPSGVSWYFENLKENLKWLPCLPSPLN